MNPNDVLTGFSRALYANWLLYKPDRILIDCGEGCATSLDGSAGKIEKLFLTHGHIDHVGGLPTLLWTRAAGGQTPTPLAIYHSSDDPYLRPLFAYVEAIRALLPFEVTWVPLEPGSRVELKPNWHLEAFATHHLSRGQSLGFRVTERKARLKAEFFSLPQSELNAIGARGQMAELTESVETLKIAFCGDSTPVEAAHVEGAEILVHEATIFEPEENAGQNHSTIRGALRVAKEARPKLLVLNHLSRHHSREVLATQIRREVQSQNITCPVWMLNGAELSSV